MNLTTWGMRCRFDVPYDCSVELSALGYQFFTDIYDKFNKVRPLPPIPLYESLFTD